MTQSSDDAEAERHWQQIVKWAHSGDWKKAPVIPPAQASQIIIMKIVETINLGKTLLGFWEAKAAAAHHIEELTVRAENAEKARDKNAADLHKLAAQAAEDRRKAEIEQAESKDLKARIEKIVKDAGKKPQDLDLNGLRAALGVKP